MCNFVSKMHKKLIAMDSKIPKVNFSVIIKILSLNQDNKSLLYLASSPNFQEISQNKSK